MNSTQLLSLLQLSDPTLPIGGFSHSAGLETYVQYEIVRNKETAKSFIAAQLSQNLFFTDAAFVSLAYDAAIHCNTKSLLRLDEECTAVKLPREMRQMSQKLGWRLMKIVSVHCKNAFVEDYKRMIEQGRATGHYALVFALCACAFSIPKADAVTAFYYNAAAGMVTTSVKLVPLGQHDGQEILFSLHPLIKELAAATMHPNKDLIGLCCTGFDVRCMQHEHLYSRLYMS